MTESSPKIDDSAARRVLKRAGEGLTLNLEETKMLLSLRGENLEKLMEISRRVRDKGIEYRDQGHIITYSKKVFIPITKLCRDRCHYCTFAHTPKELDRAGVNHFMSINEIVDLAKEGAKLGCKEALFTLGDRPEDRWPEAKQWLDEAGYDTTIDYVRAAAIAVLEETGLLPHLNPGVMSWEEMTRLKPVAPSMGMMLETSSTRLYEEKGEAHYGSPDKDPKVRLETLVNAGRISIPFTTGLLIGIGETITERAQSLLDLQKISKQYRHFQEVIIQNFRAKPTTPMRHKDDLGLDEYLATIATASIVLGAKVPIQAPPNLVDLKECERLIQAGISDWGGISPLTPDHVNPERPWPEIEKLAELTKEQGFTLTERLTIHPQYLKTGAPWFDPRLKPHLDALSDHKTFLANPNAKPIGRPWQEPDDEWESSGRTDLYSTIDTDGRITEHRSDIDTAYGDWESVKTVAQSIDSTPAAHTDEILKVLRMVEKNPAGLSDEQYLTLANLAHTGQPEHIAQLAKIADDLRKDTVGETVTYVVNRNINFTNICYTGCRFCAFAQRKNDADAYTLSYEEVSDKAYEAHVLGATEVCIQGGIDPMLPATGYLEIAKAIKARIPQMHVHAYSPMEIVNGATRADVSIKEWLQEVKNSGVDSIPGTAAEILDDEVRWILTKGKLPTASWINVITTAHKIGLPSSSTMMYGHVDQPKHWVKHLNVIKGIQDETGGFSEFVLLPFVHSSSPIYLAGVARAGATKPENIVVNALARIMLHGRIKNIQTSWVKLGTKGTQLMLQSGANDLGGTLMEETISRMAGSEHGSAKTIEELQTMAREINRPYAQRLTNYDLVKNPASAVSLI